MNCPVCRNATTQVFLSVDVKTYRKCGVCHATFLNCAAFVSKDVEHAHYQTHRNDVADRGYRQFLSRLADPLLQRLGSGQCGLDYGCGPGPALAAMMQEAGHSMQVFDPFFQPDPSVLATTYDFVTCTEVAEHFHNPADEFARFDGLLRPGGWLAIMTRFVPDDIDFAKWYYLKDPTHVVFYRAETFQKISDSFGWACEFPVGNVALMQKPQ